MFGSFVVPVKPLYDYFNSIFDFYFFAYYFSHMYLYLSYRFFFYHRNLARQCAISSQENS